MLATLGTHPFDSPDWLFEVKWDGYRVQAIVSDGAVRTFTRNGNDAAHYFPGLLSPVTWLAASSAVVDGEVVALDPHGAPSFELLQQRISGDPAVADAPLVYMAFDLLYLDGRSLLKVPLEDRKRLLRSVLRDHARVRYASHVEREGRTFFAAAEARDLEGIVAKKRQQSLRAGPPVRQLAQDQGPARAGARRRWVRAGGGEPQGPRRRCSSACTRASDCATPGGSAAASTPRCARR